MTDPSPGNPPGNLPAPTNPPIEFEDDGAFRHEGYWNSFQFDPPLTHEDALVLVERAVELGYRMLFRKADYSLEEVQDLLEQEGPSVFLNMTWLEEDISPKEPPPRAEQRLANRLRKLAPTAELIVTDPYLFTRARTADRADYAASVGRIFEPALTEGLRIVAIVPASQNEGPVREAVEAELHARRHGMTISVIEAEDFHDRFWIADRARGFVMGSSLNKIGGRIFFVDELSDADRNDVLVEVDRLMESN